MNQKLKNNRGITLIALVVTIVVLLILAGVSISLILDNNGIIQKSKDAKREYGQARAKEQVDLDKVDSWIDNVLNAPDVVEPENIDDWIYTEEDDGTITLNCYKGRDTEVVIPNYINGIPVKKINYYGWDKNSAGITLWGKNICEDTDGTNYCYPQNTITKVIISPGIESIGWHMFCKSIALKEIVIPRSVKSIGVENFYLCSSLEKIYVGWTEEEGLPEDVPLNFAYTGKVNSPEIIYSK